MRRTNRMRGLTAGIVCAFALALVASIGSAPRGVSAQVMSDGWELAVLPCPTGGGFGVAEFVNGPGIPSSGSGSYQFSFGAVSPGWLLLRQEGLHGVPLSSLQVVQYATFVTVPGTQAAPYLMLQVDLDGDEVADDSLIYMPAHNGQVVPFEWQSWDARDGVWWSTSGRAGLTQATPGTLDAYLASYPDATLANGEETGALAVVAGCLGGFAWASWSGAIDFLEVAYGTTAVTWDFEPTGVMTTHSRESEEPIVFTDLTPAPWSTVPPGEVTIAFTVTSGHPITGLSVWLNDQQLTPETGGPSETQLGVFTIPVLDPGLYQVHAMAEDAAGREAHVMWQFVVSEDPADTWWFLADGTPRRSAIEASLRALVEAFRWHLFGDTWDGVAHAEMPTHADVSAGSIRFDAFTPARHATVAPGLVQIAVHVTSGSPVTSFQLWLNDQPLDVEIGGPSETDQTAFTERSLAAGSYAVRARVENADGEALTVTWGFVVSPFETAGHWFTADGQLKADTVTRTLKALVEAFRWHFYGESWDGQPHPELPTHATTVTGPQPIEPWFTEDGSPIPENIAMTIRSLEEAFRWHFWAYRWDGQPHGDDIPTHVE